MKKYMTYAAIGFFATTAFSFAAPDKDAIISREKTAWQAFKDKKADEFGKFLHSDMMAVYSDGIMTKNKEVDSQTKSNMKSFTLDDINVAFPDADTATITYKVTFDATMDGKDISGKYNSGSVWRKQNGEWDAIFHTNVKEDETR